MKPAFIDYLILAVYFAFVLGIGWRLRKRISTSGDFLTAGHSVPVWITSLAFLAANLGAQELVGMSGAGAKYGIMQSHFYWIGAVPAMIFVGLFMMPFYYGSRARSVPEYLKLRFDEKTRTFNACTFAVMTIFSSGISMYALGLLLELVLGWSFTTSDVYKRQFQDDSAGQAPACSDNSRDAPGACRRACTIGMAVPAAGTRRFLARVFASRSGADTRRCRERRRGHSRAQ